jgi:hypothetical protein
MAMGKEIAMSGNGVREDFTNNGIEIGRHAGRVAWRREGRKGQGKNPSDGKRGASTPEGPGVTQHNLEATYAHGKKGQDPWLGESSKKRRGGQAPQV